MRLEFLDLVAYSGRSCKAMIRRQCQWERFSVRRVAGLAFATVQEAGSSQSVEASSEAAKASPPPHVGHGG